MAEYRVYIDWSFETDNIFKIGESAIGSTLEGLGGTFVGTFSAEIDNVTSSLRDATIDRGRDSAFTNFRMGRATVRLVDPEGQYNPRAGLAKPMRPVKIVYYDGTDEHELFRGWVRRFRHEAPGGDNPGITVCECVDALYWMNRFQPSVAATPSGHPAGSVIGSILDAGGSLFNDIPRSIDSGDAIASFSADSDTKALSEVANILQVDLGEFYVDKGGTITYNGRGTRSSRTSQGTIVGSFGLSPTTDVDNIMNKLTASHDGTVFTTAENEASTGEYGELEGDTVTNQLFTGSIMAASYAKYRVSVEGEPTQPLGPVSFRDREGQAKGTAAFAMSYERDLGDLVTITDEAAQIIDEDYFIESIRHSIRPGKLHEWSWGLTRKTSNNKPFVIGSSGLDSNDVLVY